MKRRNLIFVFMMSSMLFTIIDVYADSSCTGLIKQELLDEIKNILKIIQFAAPVLLLLLTSIDFAKVVFNDNKDGIEKAKNNFLKRAVATLIVFFAPMIITLILDLAQESRLRGCLSGITN